MLRTKTVQNQWLKAHTSQWLVNMMKKMRYCFLFRSSVFRRIQRHFSAVFEPYRNTIFFLEFSWCEQNGNVMCQCICLKALPARKASKCLKFSEWNERVCGYGRFSPFIYTFLHCAFSELCLARYCYCVTAVCARCVALPHTGLLIFIIIFVIAVCWQ